MIIRQRFKRFGNVNINDETNMILIRKAKQEDREPIWSVHVQAIQEVCKSHYSENELAAWSGVLKPSRYTADIGNKTFLVAEDKNVIVGFGRLNQQNGNVEAVYVHPNYIRQGVGKKILNALERVAQDFGLATLHLWASLNALPFYQSQGYAAQWQTRYLLPFGRVACVYMVKNLIQKV